MKKYFNSPVYNSDEGNAFYQLLSQNIPKPLDMTEFAILSIVRIMVYLPEDVSNAIIAPVAALPLLINHADDTVKLIAKLRLQAGI